MYSCITESQSTSHLFNVCIWNSNLAQYSWVRVGAYNVVHLTEGDMNDHQKRV